ncbi:MAG: hypothetical protein HY812_22360 [Planctomycetes bacterium]|nr:hypothetical protein [Planctomycetota bacterium]
MAQIVTDPSDQAQVGTDINVTITGLVSGDTITWTLPGGRANTVNWSSNPREFVINTTGSSTGTLEIKVTNPGPPPTATIHNVVLV